MPWVPTITIQYMITLTLCLVRVQVGPFYQHYVTYPTPNKTMTPTALNSGMHQTIPNSNIVGFHLVLQTNIGLLPFDSPFPDLQRERVEFTRSIKPQQTPSLLLFSFCLWGRRRKLQEIKQLNSVFPKVWSLDQQHHLPEMVRKVNYQVSLQTHRIRNSGVKAQISVLKSLPSDSNAYSSLRTTGLVKSQPNKSCLVRT